MPSSTHYFILSYDSATKQWSHDYDKEEELFPDGTIHTIPSGLSKYGYSADQWSGGYLGDGSYNKADTTLCEKITKVIDKLNK
jgi:hypothetical protein